MLLKAFVIVLVLSCPVFAGNDIYISSKTATVDSAKTLCSGNKRGFLHMVCMNKFSLGATMAINNNAGANPVAFISAPNYATCLSYDVEVSSGLAYTTVGIADWTILYNCH